MFVKKFAHVKLMLTCAIFSIPPFVKVDNSMYLIMTCHNNCLQFLDHCNNNFAQIYIAARDSGAFPIIPKYYNINF